ncbi:MAG: DUF5681 domain-containing protein [Minwuia sp.]|uniref:DUF5681 domain-containing protein n=1 Tax=Minwuia sp. TaxID=2493630 RepID=UPI003A87BBED
MPENTDQKQANAGQFQPGQSGNPAGRPRGALNKTTLAVLELLDGEAEGLTRKAVELALDGDTTALRLCLERIAPPVKDRPVSFDLPAIETLNNAADAMAALLKAVSEGQVTPSEATGVASIVETYRRTVESADLEDRIAALEARHAEA